MNIKVKNTRVYKDVVVAEGKLVLVECKVQEALLWKNNIDQLRPVTDTREIIHTLNKFYNPIIISETEKIEEGDHFYWDGTTKQIMKADYSYEAGSIVRKILALPEHFSPKHLQEIVDGGMNDKDKVLIECEQTQFAYIYERDLILETEYTSIKLNSQGHITLHKIEEKTYKESELPLKQIGEVLRYLEDQSVYNKMGRWNDPYYKLKKWF